MARPKLDIDGTEVFRLAKLGCKVTEIADDLNCDPDTIWNRFSVELRKGRSAHRLELRERFEHHAKKGNSVILMQLGRRYLGFGDRSLDEHVLEAIEAAGLDQDDLLELIQNKNKLFTEKPKRSFHEFCAKAGYPTPFDLQVKMREFGIEETAPRILLGSRGYGKTDYVTLLGTAYDLYLHPLESTTLIITKSKDRNAAILEAIADACVKNGMVFDVQNTTRLCVVGTVGKEDSVSAVPIKTKGLRGRHPKRIIMDDPVTEDDTSEATRTHARKILNEAMKLSENILLIGQPAHQYDLYADVRGNIKTMEVPYGSIPELDPDLDAQRIAGVSDASISASYFLKVLSEGTSPFGTVKSLDHMPQGPAVAFIDPSDGGDYTALTILKGYFEGVAIVGFVRKKAWNHCLDEFADLLVKYGVKKLAFEINMTGEQPIELLRGLDAFKSMGIVGVRSTDNKHSKIMAAGTFAHQIHLCKESDKLYLDHVIKYEHKSKYDDAPDSLASCMKWVGLIRGKK
jgi:hypothetical protein